MQLLKIVVASPSDVQIERGVLRNVAEELNRGIAADRDLRLEVYCWETDSYPGFHPAGPQGLIDAALNIESCDLLVGIFWRRFGTAVADAKSGTEHEFRLAYDAWKRHQHPQIMVYFNQQPDTPKSKADTDQHGLVLKFKEEFPKEGLWWPYNGTTDFERLVRNHLTQFIRQSVPLNRPASTPNSDPATVSAAQVGLMPSPASVPKNSPNVPQETDSPPAHWWRSVPAIIPIGWLIIACLLLGATYLVWSSLLLRRGLSNHPQFVSPESPIALRHISGTVRDAETQQVLVGATVTIQNVNAAGRSTTACQTDSFGTYRFGDIAPQSTQPARLHASQPGYHNSYTDQDWDTDFHTIDLDRARSGDDGRLAAQERGGSADIPLEVSPEVIIKGLLQNSTIRVKVLANNRYQFVDDKPNEVTWENLWHEVAKRLAVTDLLASNIAMLQGALTHNDFNKWLPFFRDLQDVIDERIRVDREIAFSTLGSLADLKRLREKFPKDDEVQQHLRRYLAIALQVHVVLAEEFLNNETFRHEIPRIKEDRDHNTGAGATTLLALLTDMIDWEQQDPDKKAELLALKNKALAFHNLKDPVADYFLSVIMDAPKPTKTKGSVDSDEQDAALQELTNNLAIFWSRYHHYASNDKPQYSENDSIILKYIGDSDASVNKSKWTRLVDDAIKEPGEGNQIIPGFRRTTTDAFGYGLLLHMLFTCFTNDALKGDLKGVISDSQTLDRRSLENLKAHLGAEYQRSFQSCWSPYVLSRKLAKLMITSDRDALCLERIVRLTPPEGTGTPSGGFALNLAMLYELSMLREEILDTQILPYLEVNEPKKLRNLRDEDLSERGMSEERFSELLHTAIRRRTDTAKRGE